MNTDANDEMISVPAYLIEAIAHVGADFGYGPYELEQRYIEEARAILAEYQRKDTSA